MKRIYVGLFLIIIITVLSIVACGPGKNSDIGSTSVVTASTQDTLVDGDIVYIEDTNNNGVCGDAGDTIYTPQEETVTVSFTAKELNKDIQVSPISVYEVNIIYIPQDSNSPSINSKIMKLGYTFEGTGTLNIPIIDTDTKRSFYQNNQTGRYRVRIILKMNEVMYDKNLTVEIGTNLTLSNRIQSGECTP